MKRYLIGIDLGTTHTVVAYADSRSPAEPRVFPIEQLVAPGEVAGRPLLDSLRYHPIDSEIPEGDRVLPWQPDPDEDPVPDALVGALARDLGAKTPGRLVSSAKSWLSHAGVDRTAAILPWGAPKEIPRISPVDASASYLRHVRRDWDHQFPDHPLALQDIVLTVPASFDEVARRLTVDAARLAGLPRIRLVEEPQAACYDWLTRHAGELDDALASVRTLLVCDLGGGTTDFTLVRVERKDGGAPRLVRIGVGDHLMLGGDNMDLALAHLAEQRLAGGTRLGAAQLSQLVQQCRGAKERLLAADAPDSTQVTLLGAGSRLIGGARTTELGRDEVQRLVVEGFFPRSEGTERPQRRRGAIQEFGLPYASDPAVPRHLAAFLADHARALGAGEDDAHEGLRVPDAVLLNGGVFHGEALTRRLLQVLGAWRGEEPVQLLNDQPDLAVARGAVAYALARRGHGARIGGGSARAFLLQVEDGDDQVRRAVCLLPKGTEEGRELRLHERVFSLRLGQPVRFNLLTAGGDRDFAPGELTEIDREHFRELPPLATVLEAGDLTAAGEAPVELAVRLTDVGTLEIDCVSTGDSAGRDERRWRMEFQVRGTAGGAQPAASTELPANFPQAAERIGRVYGPPSAAVSDKETKTLQRDLEKLLGKRADWDTALLRELFDVLWEGAKRRRRSADHERLWLNLAGFCLRPGYGHPLDDWRMQLLRPLYDQGLAYRNEARNQAEWWTLWRRVAGGLDAAAQLHILDQIQGQLRPPAKRGGKNAKAAAPDHLVRLAGSLGRIPAERKAELGKRLLRAGRRPTDLPQRWWALGRLGTRVPFHGQVQDIVPAEQAAAWMEEILRLDWKQAEPALFAATQLSRMSGDRERDLDDALRRRVVERLRAAKAPPKWIAMVEEVTELDSTDASLVFGESLPPGLRLVS
jgi:molecular chaperone DnaK (HSP70)